MFDKKDVNVDVIVVTLIDAINALNRILQNKTVDKDDLERSKLIVTQFKQDFSEKLLDTTY